MASRPIVPQQPRGAVVPGIVAKQKNNDAERKNRRALGDIGNLNRPVTRSFCAQLLANAQVAGGNKKVPATMVDGVLILDEPRPQKGRAAKAAPHKVTVKPVPDKVIEISPDTEEKNKQQKPVNQRKSREVEGSSKKKIQSMTAVLTARSKVACGLTNKPKDPIHNIDAADVDDPLAVVEYIEDIHKFYKQDEIESQIPDYMGSQPEINDRMREILVDWLIEVHHKFELLPETLYLTLNIVDRFLSKEIVIRRELQLLGIGAMLIASKYEEIWAPEVNDFICISDKAYTREQLLRMEKTILGKLEWTLTVPTLYVFLVRFIKAAQPDKEMENLAFFLAELGIMRYATIKYCPSMLAASVVYTARCTLNRAPFWTETLELHTGYTETQLMDCAKQLVTFHTMAAESRLKVVYRKYSNPQRGAIALVPPAKFLLDPSRAC